MTVSTMAINSGIKNVVAAATGIERSYDYDELPEAINNGDTPALAVYWDSIVMDPVGETDRSSFSAGIRQVDMIFNIDLYASQRNHLAENNQAVVETMDAILTALQTQSTHPPFGVDGVQSFKVMSAQRVTHDYGGARFPGVRIVLAVRVF